MKDLEVKDLLASRNAFSFGVPFGIIDEYFAETTQSELKVLLYVLRHAVRDPEREFTIDEIAHGCRSYDNTRLDHGTGLSEHAIRKVFLYSGFCEYLSVTGSTPPNRGHQICHRTTQNFTEIFRVFLCDAKRVAKTRSTIECSPTRSPSIQTIALLLR